MMSKRKWTDTTAKDVVTISGSIWNSDTRTVANAVNYNAQILKDALNRIEELEKNLKSQVESEVYMKSKIWIATYWNTEIEPVVTPFDNKEAAETCARYYERQGYKVCIDECDIFHTCTEQAEESEKKMTKEEALDWLISRKEHYEMDDNCQELAEAIDIGINAIKHEMNTGHWIWDTKSKVYRCSCCNHFPWGVRASYPDEIFEDLTRTNAYKYCPNCDAKMVKQ